MLDLPPNRAARAVVAVIICLMLSVGISSCGKRGDPYRPSEVSSSS